jgi:hypothetical protein
VPERIEAVREALSYKRRAGTPDRLTPRFRGTGGRCLPDKDWIDRNRNSKLEQPILNHIHDALFP